MELISGEKLQEIADVTFFGTNNCNIPDQLKHTNTVIRHKDEFGLNDSENIVFVYGHDLDLFFTRYFNQIEKPIKVISHNSDEHITERFRPFLDNPKLIHWYGQNAVYDHPKLTPIPIGMANTQWPHGNKEKMRKAIDQKQPKTYLVYKNFDISTNSYVRRDVDIITTRNGIKMDMNRPFDQYLEILAKTLFVISPPGNGVDCHRIWECLYLNAVPVVQRSSAFRNFTDLPILFIDNWNEVTPAFLNSQIANFKEKPLSEKLDLNYWRKLIKS